MTLGRIVEVTFTLIRRHARVLIPLYAVVDLPLYVLTTIASDAFVADLTQAVGPGGLAEPAAISAEEAAILLPGFLQVMATTLLLGVVSAIGAGAIAIAVREALEDRPPRFLAALGGAVRRSVALIGSSLIALAATVALLAVGFGMLVLLGIASGGPALTPGGGVTTFLALIVAIGSEIAQQRIARPADIDLAVKAGLGYPLGPLAMGDELGPRRILQILEAIHASTADPRYRPGGWLRRRALLGLSLLVED